MEGVSGSGLPQPVTGWIAIRLDIQGKYFKVYANGNLVISAYDSRIAQAGIGQGATRIGGIGNTQFDDIKLWVTGSN